jgi:SAM-dependent methyltransferase
MIENKFEHMKNVSATLKTKLMSMTDMDFTDGSFDLIWSEGAIYIAGFSNGLKSWKRLLKPKGYLVASEVVWLKPDAPKDIREFWESEYSEIDLIDGKLDVIAQAGYQTITHFTLPHSVWETGFYQPMQTLINDMRGKDMGKEFAEFLDGMQYEIDMFRQFGEWYSYEFFVMQKV